MLWYIIDGFNLIHRVSSLKNSPTPQSPLIAYIRKNNLTGSRNNKVTIVFDGKFVPLNETNFEIIFGQDRSADAIIKEKVQGAINRSQSVVVSDDQEVRYSAKKLGAQVCRIADFIKTKKRENQSSDKEISYPLQREITEEVRKIWLKE